MFTFFIHFLLLSVFFSYAQIDYTKCLTILITLLYGAEDVIQEILQEICFREKIKVEEVICFFRVSSFC